MDLRNQFASLSRGKQIALACGGVLAVAIIGYLVLVSPERSKAHDLEAQTASVRAQIASKQSSPTAVALARVLPAVRAADIFQLTRAMPKDVDMANVILELNQLATNTGLSFDEITPKPLVTTSTYNVQPIELSFTGSYYNLLDFLFRVRNLVGVHGITSNNAFNARNLLGIHGAKLYSAGRMYAVSDVSFSEAPQHFPFVTVSLTVDTFELPKGAPAAATQTALQTTSQIAGGATTPSTTTTTTGSH